MIIDGHKLAACYDAPLQQEIDRLLHRSIQHQDLALSRLDQLAYGQYDLTHTNAEPRLDLMQRIDSIDQMFTL